MHTTQTILILGAGKTGRGIAKGLSGSKDRVILCDSDINHAEACVNDLKTHRPEFDIEAQMCSYEASWEADIIILDLACDEMQEAAQKIKKVANRKIVVTTGPYLEELKQQLPNSKVVQAFSTVDALFFEESVTRRKAVDCFVTGDDDEAVKLVADLVRTIGFKPVLTLEESKY